MVAFVRDGAAARRVVQRVALVVLIVVVLMAPIGGVEPAAASGAGDEGAPPTPMMLDPTDLPPEALAKIDPALLDALLAAHDALGPSTPQPHAQPAAEGTVTYLVYLEEASLGDLTLPSDRVERLRTVVARLQEHAEHTQRGALGALQTRLASGRVARYYSYWIANVLIVEGGLEAAVALALLPAVVAVAPNRSIPMAQPRVETISQAAPDIAWGVDRIDAERVWTESTITGRGIVVANMDSGVDWTHPDLQRKYRGFDAANPAASDHNYNWVDLTGTYPDAPGPRDTSGNYVAKVHGTHVMGTMVGSSPDDATITGVAPDARWIAVKVFDDGGQPATEEAFLAGFQWLLAPTDLNGRNPDPSKAPDVVCNSWGDDEDGGTSMTFARSVAALRAAGIAAVFSAGNSGPGVGTIDSPASYTDTLAIGATNPGDLIAEFSSRGPSPWGHIKPDVVAPGVSIVSTAPGGGYATLSGTSMAAPHAAGTLALVLQADRQAFGVPTMTITTTESILRDTAVDLGDPGPDNTYGYGRVDAYAAVRATQNIHRLILPLVYRRAPSPRP